MKNIKALVLFLVISFIYNSCGNQQPESAKLTDWVNDSLNIKGYEVSTRWMDTTNTNMAFALYRGDTCNIRLLFIERKQKVDIPVSVVNLPDGPVKITPLDTTEYNGVYYIVNQGILEMYNKEGKLFSKATRLPEKAHK
ncbi:hypothetical protein LJC00_04590 [Dysgonomonas sp. OttesenSCG-928-M03]|nr:hypothetical protein [Dysgonomonas sp. OttesenSCG-928-M03]